MKTHLNRRILVIDDNRGIHEDFKKILCLTNADAGGLAETEAALFDETPCLVAWNRHFQEMFDLPDDLLAQHRTYEQHLRFLAARGDFGSERDTEEQLRALVTNTDRPSVYERTRPDGRVLEIRRNPVRTEASS